MKTFSKYFTSIILIFLVTVVIYLFFKLWNTNREIFNKNDLIKHYEYRIDKEVEKFSKEIFSDNEFLGDIFLTNVKGDSIQISQLLETPKFIYRFSYESCFTCVEADIEQLHQFGDIIGYQNIIIISDYEYIRTLAAFKDKYNIKSQLFTHKKSFNLAVESNSTKATFYFVLDKTLKVELVFLSEPSLEFESRYFERIKEIFLN